MSLEPEGRLERALPLILALALLGLVAGLTLQQTQSNDYWWHLRTGRLIAETGSVPRADPYTFTVPGARWVDIHWLFQLALWQVYRLGGHDGVTWARLACVLGLVALLAPLGFRRDRAWLSAAALALVLLVASDRLMARPELPSFLLLAALLRLFDRFERTGDAWIYAVVPIQVLWANVHGLFAVGLAVCAIHLAGELALPLGQPGASLRWARVRRLAAVTALGALAAFANPNGGDGALYPLQQLGMIGDAETRGFFGSHNRELRPALVGLTGAQLLLFALLGGLSATAAGFNWRRVRPAELLMLAAFLYLALGAVRNVALFAVVAGPILVRNANEVFDARGLPARSTRAAGPVVAAALVLLAVDAASARLHARLGDWRLPGLGADERFLPAGAVDWIERQRPPGPIAHHMQDGGYLIWRLHPSYRAMSDGRLEVFGPEIFRSLLFDSAERFVELDARYRFGAVIARHDVGGGREVLAHLEGHPAFTLVHVDDVAALYVRTPAAGDPPPPLDLDRPDLFPPLGRGHPWVDQASLRKRTAFFSSVGRYDLAFATWQAGLALFPDLEGGEHVRKMLEATGARR
ncbi:MAG: hypothetical protein QNK04_33490 [Myxococcota bacterium]|nr:hypothetical protein [Myxococcota bacterium]